MKKILPLIASFVSLVFSINAQNDSLERAIQYGYYTDYNYAIKEFPAQRFYIGFNSSDSLGASQRTYITRINEDGTTEWKLGAFDSIYESGRVNKILQALDKNIVLSGYTQVCDLPTGNGCVQKVSRFTGNTIWLKTFDFDYGNGFGNDMVELPDSGFWVANKNMLYRLNSNGDSLTSISYNYGRIYKMILTPSNYIILGCFSGLLRIDTAGNVLDSLPLPKAVKFLNSYNDSLYFAIAGRVIYKADSLFALVALDSTFYFTPEVNALLVFNNRLWILHHQYGSNFSKLVKWDYNFGYVGQQVFSDFDGSDFDAQDLLANYHSFELLVHERTNKLSNHLLLKNWINATDSTYYYNTDVGVTGFYADSSTSYGTILHIGTTTLIYPTFDIYVNVKNYGQAPVNEVYLNAVIDTTVAFCLPYVYGNKFSGFNIQPGDSAYIHLGFITPAAYDSATNPTNERYLCFWTSSPNSHMDYNHFNDNLCLVLNVNNFAGINEIHGNDFFSIQPNPANNELAIKINSTINRNNLSATVSNILGEVVIGKLNFAGEIILDVSKLTPGIYVVKVESGTNFFMQKFVKH